MENVKNLQSDRQTNDVQQAICKVHLAFSSGELKRGILQVYRPNVAKIYVHMVFAVMPFEIRTVWQSSS